jgi:hypothetical protein
MALLRRRNTRDDVQDKRNGAVEYLRKLTVVQLAKKYIAFYRTRMSITILTSVPIQTSLS